MILRQEKIIESWNQQEIVDKGNNLQIRGFCSQNDNEQYRAV
jgi:hypothetical protein